MNKLSAWTIRFNMDKNNCGCDPVPTTSGEHKERALALTRSIYADGNEPNLQEGIHIDHHFKHGA